MREIVLTNGGSTRVDDDWFDRLSQFNWQQSPQGYAYRCESRNRTRITILMHRVIAGAIGGQIVDHINRDKLDNRAINLRLASQSQNGVNSKERKGNTSGYRNVTFRKDTKKWQAGLCRNRKYINLGSWLTPERAHAAVVAYLKTKGE